jgi:hypothetical protein
MAPAAAETLLVEKDVQRQVAVGRQEPSWSHHPLLEGTTAFATKSSYHPDLKFPQNTPPTSKKKRKKKKNPNNITTPQNVKTQGR